MLLVYNLTCKRGAEEHFTFFCWHTIHIIVCHFHAALGLVCSSMPSRNAATYQASSAIISTLLHVLQDGALLAFGATCAVEFDLLFQGSCATIWSEAQAHEKLRLDHLAKGTGSNDLEEPCQTVTSMGMAYARLQRGATGKCVSPKGFANLCTGAASARLRRVFAL